jgi:glycosyltransferase involved in cell wall biosynthesis
MRVLVALNHLELGGAQLNALDFAKAVRDRGSKVTVFATYEDEPGPLAGMVRAAGFKLVLARYPAVMPGLLSFRRPVARALSRLVAQESVQLVHANEPALILDSFYGPHLRLGVPVVGTIYGDWVPWWLPRYLPLIVGTQEQAEAAAQVRTDPPVLIRPPVNTDTDAPELVDAAGFRRTYGLGSDIVVTVVSRLEPTMKADGIELAIDAIHLLDDRRIRLVVVGDGPSFTELNASAERVNASLGRRAVVMTGPLADPRPAYAATDISLGMGSSALRSMAFGKPLIVVGTKGFAKPFRPATAHEFLFGSGFFGVGTGNLDPRPLADEIRALADRPELRSQLGAFGAQVVLERCSLKAASESLVEVYAAAVARRYPMSLRLREASRAVTCRAATQILPAGAKESLRPALQPLLRCSSAWVGRTGSQ